jgi:hypothetical protein
MQKKLLVIILATLMVTVLAADLFAGARVRWAGNYAGTLAATYVPGATNGSATPPAICRDMQGGAPPPAIVSTCWATRTPGWGGAWAFAYANIVGGVRISAARAGRWGPITFAGKADPDTTTCSTYVEIIPQRGVFDLNVYTILEANADVNGTAHCMLTVEAQGQTIFSGGIYYNGDSTATTVDGEFNVVDIVYGEGTAEFAYTFPGIDYGGIDPDSVEITLINDVKPERIPSMTVYGIIGLVLLLIISTLYLFYRRRQKAQAL